MNIEIVKKELNKHIGKNVLIKHNLGRNKYESYNAIIKKLYNNIFVVENDECQIRSFTYTDIITKIIKIEF